MLVTTKVYQHSKIACSHKFTKHFVNEYCIISIALTFGYIHFELDFILGCEINGGCFIRKWAKTTNKVSLLACFCFYTDIANNSAESISGEGLVSLSLFN